ncbi:MAG: cache domain-containing protein, partial [Pseudomonadota bacterium]|nr:cache domain-containing protein [Pseudomonadota bacterium]
MRQFWNRYAIGLLRRIAIRTRLMGSLVLLSLLPLLISGILSYAQSSRAIERNTRLFATEIVKQVARNIELQMAQTEATSEALVLSPRVQSALAEYEGGSAAQSSTARSDLTHILLDAYGSFSYINQKYFLGTDRHVADAQVFPQLSDAVERAVKNAVKRAPTLRGRPLWTTLATQNQQASVVMLRDIYFKSSNRLAGTLFLGIRSSHFASVFETVDLGPDSDIFIVDAHSGEIVVQTRQQFERVGRQRV